MTWLAIVALVLGTHCVVPGHAHGDARSAAMTALCTAEGGVRLVAAHDVPAVPQHDPSHPDCASCALGAAPLPASSAAAAPRIDTLPLRVAFAVGPAVASSLTLARMLARPPPPSSRLHA